MEAAAAQRQVRKELFGHPRGLAFLFATEMWERFSYYGMRALLVLYLVKYLLLPGHAEHVIGLATLKSGMEAIAGPLDTQPFASQIYGLYTALVYLTPIFGGLLADRVLGQRRTVLIGAALMALGHFMMAFEPLLLFALLTLILANGAFKPNISTQVGELYAPGDPRRDRAFSVFYAGINVGAFFSPLVCGTLGEALGWHYGFAAAGIGMLIALLIYMRGLRELPPDELQRARAAHREHDPLSREDWLAIAALLVLFLPNTLFWATYEQQGNTIALWADTFTDRGIDLLFWRVEIPVTWFQAFNPFMIFAFTPVIAGLWGWQARRGTEPATITKMAIGCFGVALANLLMAFAAVQTGASGHASWLFGVALANLLMAFAAVQTGASGHASWLWLFFYFVIVTIGELYLSPVGLSLVSKVAPGRVLSLMMGVWLATSFVGNFLAGWLGSYWSSMDKPAFFIMIAGVAALAGVAIALISKPLRKILPH
jgi:proton-dependent oligopeptide transporter, POT family